MSVINKMKLTILAKSQNESFARSTVAAFFAQINPTLEQINDIKTAVSEAVTNCIVHGYKGEDGNIDISAELTENSVTVKITDYGAGIADVNKAMEPFFTTVSTGDRSGIGFTVMQAFCDEVDVTSEPGNYTTVKLTKAV